MHPYKKLSTKAMTPIVAEEDAKALMEIPSVRSHFHQGKRGEGKNGGGKRKCTPSYDADRCIKDFISSHCQ
jgi:hypothetical protein